MVARAETGTVQPWIFLEWACCWEHCKHSQVCEYFISKDELFSEKTLTMYKHLLVSLKGHLYLTNEFENTEY